MTGPDGDRHQGRPRTGGPAGPPTAAWFPAGDPRARADRGPATAAVGLSPAGAPPPGRGSRHARIAGVVVGVAVLVAAAVVTVALATRGDDPAPAQNPVAASGTPTPSDTAASTTSTPTRSRSSASTSTPVVSAPPTRSPTGIDISAIGTDPAASEVTRVFDTYFTGVNAHDAASAASVFAPGAPIDPSNPGQVARFGADIATTVDTAIVISSITPTATGLDVLVTFTNTQSAALGPDGQTCTNWQIVYHLVPAGSGYGILKASAEHQAC